MESKNQNSLLVPDRLVPVQKNHNRWSFRKGIVIFFLAFAPFLGVCDLFGEGNSPVATKKGDTMATAKKTTLAKAQNPGTDAPAPGQTEIATFAGGCFWCTEADFEKVEGVMKVVSGYTGGHKENPTYEEASSGTTGHVEAIQVYYDPAKISYGELLNWFWRQICGPRLAVPERNFLPQRRAETAGGKI